MLLVKMGSKATIPSRNPRCVSQLRGAVGETRTKILPCGRPVQNAALLPCSVSQECSTALGSLSRTAHQGRIGPSSENFRDASSSSSAELQSTVHDWISTDGQHIHSGHIRTHKTAGKPSRLRCCPVNTHLRDQAWPKAGEETGWNVVGSISGRPTLDFALPAPVGVNEEDSEKAHSTT